MENLKDVLLSSKEVSKYLSIPLRTLQNLSKQGKIKSIRIGKYWKYKKSDIDKYFSYGTDFSYEPARSPVGFSERREYIRINCHIDSVFYIDLPQRNKVVQGTITNISGNGLLIRCNANQASIEDPVDLEFAVNINGDKTLVETKGRVVRKTENCLGIKYRNISKDYQDKIIKYVG